MAFRFPLEVLLRLQRSVERQRELLLQVANARVDQATLQIEQVESWIRAYSDRQAQGLQTGMNAAEMHFAERCHEVLKDYKQSLEAELSKLEKIRAERRSAFEEARRQREVTHSLRERQLQAYRSEVRRREQRQVDDMFVMRRAPSRSE
jgi:flagellar export protein FliJ